MVEYDRLKVKGTDKRSHWAYWPTHGIPPKGSFMLITFIFLAESNVGTVQNKAVNRTIGTIIGAVTGKGEHHTSCVFVVEFV